MKIAITSKGKNLDSEIDKRFARCEFFLIVDVDEEIKLAKYIENSVAQKKSGAGLSAAKLIAEEKVDAVITGNVGPRAFQVLNQFGIKIYKMEGNVRDAVQKISKGKLKEIGLEEAEGSQI